jgi:hypothetical protein
MRPSLLVKVALKLVKVISCALQLMAQASASNTVLIAPTLTNRSTPSNKKHQIKGALDFHLSLARSLVPVVGLEPI